jgi:hypothetical protein
MARVRVEPRCGDEVRVRVRVEPGVDMKLGLGLDITLTLIKLTIDSFDPPPLHGRKVGLT